MEYNAILNRTDPSLFQIQDSIISIVNQIRKFTTPDELSLP
jgi:hypothetical protein